MLRIITKNKCYEVSWVSHRVGLINILKHGKPSSVWNVFDHPKNNLYDGYKWTEQSHQAYDLMGSSRQKRSQLTHFFKLEIKQRCRKPRGGSSVEWPSQNSTVTCAQIVRVLRTFGGNNIYILDILGKLQPRSL